MTVITAAQDRMQERKANPAVMPKCRTQSVQRERERGRREGGRESEREGEREKERERGRERERERACATEGFQALSRAANALTHACLLQSECRVLIDKTSCHRDPDIGMPQRVLPEVESAACTTPVEANMPTSSGQPKSGSVHSSSGSDSESPSAAVSSVDAENAGKTVCGTDVAASAGGVTAGKLVACSGVQGSEPGCEISNLKKPQGAVLISLRKDSMETGMAGMGSCAPRCCGVRGRSPARTAARSCCCARSAPRTSSRLYNSRELPRWWPWESLSGPRILGTSSI